MRYASRGSDGVTGAATVVTDAAAFGVRLRVARGGSPASRDMDSEQADVLNGLIVTLRRGLPMEQVVADLRSVRERVLEAIAAAPEHALSGEAYGDFPVDGSISHDAEHAAAIREWRQREGI